MTVRGLVLATALVASVLAPPAVAATAVASTGADAPRFLDAPYREHRGDEVRIPVALPNGSAANLTIEGPDGSYEARVRLHDGSGDGRVTLLFNSFAAGRDGAGRTARVARAADSAAVRSETTVVGSLAVGAYRLAVAPGVNATPTADANATATLHLQRPGPVDLSVLRAAPGAAPDLTTSATVDAIRRTSDLSRTVPDSGAPARVTPEEVLVLSLRAPGLAGALAAAEGPNASARFRSLLGDGLDLHLEEDEGTVETSEQQFTYHLREATGYRVVPAPANDTYFLVLGTGDEIKRAASSVDYQPVEPLDVFRFDALVGVARGTNATDGVSVQFVVAGHAGLETTERDQLPPVAANGTVTGVTTLRAGERVTVRLESDFGDPFPLERRVRVRPDGRFVASFDLSAVPPGTPFEAVLRHANQTADTGNGVVGPVARVRFGDFPAFVQHVESLAVDSVYATRGGFVAFHLGSSDGPVVGVSEHLRAGNHSNVAVTLQRDFDGNVTLVAVAHRDADDDRRFDPDADPVYGAGTPAVEARLVDLDGTPTPSPTPSPTATLTPTETPPGHDDLPGFGPAVAVVALVAAIAVGRAVRSRRGGDGA